MRYLHEVGDAELGQLFKFRSGTHGLNEELGRHRGRLLIQISLISANGAKQPGNGRLTEVRRTMAGHEGIETCNKEANLCMQNPQGERVDIQKLDSIFKNNI